MLIRRGLAPTIDCDGLTSGAASGRPPFVSGTELPGVTVIELFAIVLMVLILMIVLWRKWLKTRALQRLSARRLGMSLGNDRQTRGEHGAPAPQ
jgi:hypothetical protein